MKTYNDIETFCRVEQVSALDLRHWTPADGTPYEYWRAGAYNQEALEILWLPTIHRAGIAWGADAVWTDAKSAKDALERYFGVNGKDMQE